MISIPVRLWLIGFTLSAAYFRASANAQTAKMQRRMQPSDPLKVC